MPRELVPELHDVLKLTDRAHNFSDFGPYQAYAPDTPTWQGVLQHHLNERFPAYPTTRDTFLLKVADGWASSFTRHGEHLGTQTSQWAVYRLWDPDRRATDQRLQRRDDIVELLKYLATDPGFEDFYARYCHIFQTRSEDADPPRAVTTLETHVRLVGRFYRFLQRSKEVQLREEEVQEAVKEGHRAAARSPQALSPKQLTHPAQLEPLKNLLGQKTNQWKIYLIRCRLRLLSRPFCAKDLNVFSLLEEFLERVREEFGDQVLFASTEELLLYADDLSIREQLSTRASRCGYYLHAQWARVSVREAEEVGAEFQKKRNCQDDVIYPSLEASLAPPLCEICQMQRATKQWPRDYVPSPNEEGAEAEQAPEGQDQLCETCFVIRSRPSKLKKLAQWAEGEVIWARFALDFDQLGEILRRLYLQYLRSLDLTIAESKAEVRFSLLAEFQEEYNRYLENLKARWRKQFGDDRTETILPDLFCLKAESRADALAVLRVYHAALKTFFPAFLGDHGCPLRLSLALCGVKHPFFEVWQQWQEQQSEVEVIAVGHGRLQLRARDLERFLQLARFPFRRSALHNLAEIARISQQLAELRFRAKGERGERDTFEQLSQFLPLGLDFQGILTLAKLVGD